MSTTTQRIARVNLIYGKGDVLNSHLNINPFTPDVSENLLRGQLNSLDGVLEEGEAEEIVAADVIDFMVLTSVNDVIANWISKLRVGGTLIIGGVDAFEASKSFYQQRLDISSFNRLVHGEQTEPYLFRRVNFSTIGMVQYLESLGMKIIKKRTNNHKYIIEAKKL